MSWKCPECLSSNNDDMLRCVCGYEATADEVSAPSGPKEKPEQKPMTRQRLRAILFAVMALLFIVINLSAQSFQGRGFADSFGRLLLPMIGIGLLAEWLSRLIAKKSHRFTEEPETLQYISERAGKSLRLGLLSIVLFPIAPFALLYCINTYRKYRTESSQNTGTLIIATVSSTIGTLFLLGVVVLVIRAMVS